MIYANNKKAFHDYHVLERFETGIELKGTEVKSIKLGQVSIKESYVRLKKGEVCIINMHVPGYKFGNRFNLDERRDRKLLLNKREIKKIIGKVTQEGFTLVPLKVYNKNGLVKVEISLAKGKKLHDKRADLAKKAHNRDVERALKDRR